MNQKWQKIRLFTYFQLILCQWALVHRISPYQLVLFDYFSFNSVFFFFFHIFLSPKTDPGTPILTTTVLNTWYWISVNIQIQYNSDLINYVLNMCGISLGREPVYDYPSQRWLYGQCCINMSKPHLNVTWHGWFAVPILHQYKYIKYVKAISKYHLTCMTCCSDPLPVEDSLGHTQMSLDMEDLVSPFSASISILNPHLNASQHGFLVACRLSLGYTQKSLDMEDLVSPFSASISFLKPHIKVTWHGFLVAGRSILRPHPNVTWHARLGVSILCQYKYLKAHLNVIWHGFLLLVEVSLGHTWMSLDMEDLVSPFSASISISKPHLNVIWHGFLVTCRSIPRSHTNVNWHGRLGVSTLCQYKYLKATPKCHLTWISCCL